MMITLQVHEAAKSKQNLYLYFIICTLALEIAAGDSFFNRSFLEPVPSTSLNMLELEMLLPEAISHVAIIAI